LISNPSLLKTGNSEYLIEHLLRLLRRNWEPERIGRVSLALVDQVGPELDNVATVWCHAAAPLTDIAQLLQEKPQEALRDLGLVLLEKLLEYNFAAASSMLEGLDLRTFNRHSNSMPRRRTRLQAGGRPR